MKKWVWQIVGWILNLMLLGWVRLKELVDWLGRGIAIHDTQEKGMIWMSGLVNWLTATPPWIPGMLAAVLTLALLANLLRPLRTKKRGCGTETNFTHGQFSNNNRTTNKPQATH